MCEERPKGAMIANEVMDALYAELADLKRQLAEILDILWRDLEDLRDPKLSVVQVAAKAANVIHWRNARIADLGRRVQIDAEIEEGLVDAKEAAEAEAARLREALGLAIEQRNKQPPAPASPTAAREWEAAEIAESKKHNPVFLRGKRTSEAEHFVLVHFQKQVEATLYTLWSLQDEITRTSVMGREKVTLSLTQVAEMLTAFAAEQTRELLEDAIKYKAAYVSMDGYYRDERNKVADLERQLADYKEEEAKAWQIDDGWKRAAIKWQSRALAAETALREIEADWDHADDPMPCCPHCKAKAYLAPQEPPK